MKKYFVQIDRGLLPPVYEPLPPNGKWLTREEVESSILEHFWGDSGLDLGFILDELFGEET